MGKTQNQTEPPVGELRVTLDEGLLDSSVAAWVIHEVIVGGDSRGVWAWCRPDPAGEAGYTEIVCTRNNGVTKADWPQGAVLGPVITKLWC